MILLLKGQKNSSGFQDGLAAFFRKSDCNRIVKEEGFQLFNNPEYSTYGRVLFRYPEFDLVLFDGYMLTR